MILTQISGTKRSKHLATSSRAIVIMTATVIVCVASPWCAAAQPDEARMSAEDLLARVRGTYARLKSYQDHGEIKSTLEGQGLAFKNTKIFRTAYDSPNRLRWEFWHRSGPGFGPWHWYVLLKRDRHISSWWSVQPVEGIQREDSFQMALAKPTGISNMNVLVVAPLLVRDGAMSAIDLMAHPKLDVEGQDVNGVMCHVVRGERLNGGPVAIWIGMDDSLIRRYQWSIDSAEVQGEISMDFHPMVNEEVDDVFQFEPADLKIIQPPSN